MAKDGKNKLLTTHSFKFLELNNATSGIWKKTIGTNAIIGVIDSGKLVHFYQKLVAEDQILLQLSDLLLLKFLDPFHYFQLPCQLTIFTSFFLRCVA